MEYPYCLIMNRDDGLSILNYTAVFYIIIIQLMLTIYKYNMVRSFSSLADLTQQKLQLDYNCNTSSCLKALILNCFGLNYF